MVLAGVIVYFNLDIITNFSNNPSEIINIIPSTSITEEIQKQGSKISKSIEETTQQTQKAITKVSEPQQTTEGESIDAINYINTKRVANGKNSIIFDSRVFQLGIARAKDMYDYGYLDHTNPQTGTCPYSMKSQFGLSSNENVAENAFQVGYEGSNSLFNPSLHEAVDTWMDSTGHRMNLLYYGHTAGAVSCYGNYCVFLGLNTDNFGEGCYTAKEGQEYAKRFENCTPEQMQEYEDLNKEYDKLPRTTLSEAEYQHSMMLYNKITNFKC